MALTIQDARVLIKRSTTASEVPTVAPSNDHTDGTWDALDIYEGELFFNIADSRAWFRSTSGIIELATINGPTDAFINGGNTYGADAIFGLTDDYGIDFIANNTNIFSYAKKGVIIKSAKPIYFCDAINSETIDIAAPNTITSRYSLKLPNAQGAANTYLKNDGSGNLSWAAASGGGGILSGTASGTDTYTTTITGPTVYNNGDAYLITFTNGNTTGSTLNINSLGAKTLYKNNDGQLIGGDIWAGGTMLCIFNSTLDGFQCIGTSANSLFIYVTNDEASAITIGQPVYVSGGTGDRIKVKKAYNTSDATSAQTIGIVVTSSIAAGQKGIVISQGQLSNLSIFPTSTWADGDFVYLGATAGSITKTKPYAPNHLVYLGYVTTASNGNAGRMYVKVQNGYEMDELHNVSAQTPSNNDGLFYNTSTSLWENKSIVTALGYTPENITNKSSSYTISSTTTYANTKALVDGIDSIDPDFLMINTFKSLYNY